MTMIRQALRDSGATAVVSMSAVSSILLLLEHLASGMVSLKTKVCAVWFIWFALLHPLQSILVRRRRCSGHWFVQYVAMAAYYLPTSLVFYAVKAVCSASTSHFDESFPDTVVLVLISLMALIFSPTTTLSSYLTNMRAYSPRDGPLDRWRFVLCGVYLACVQWEWTRISSANHPLLKFLYQHLQWPQNNQGLVPRILTMNIHFLYLLVFLSPSNPPESTLDYETKEVAEYMKRESKSNSPFFQDGGGEGDANSSSLHLDCCRYPFTQRRKDGQWISIKDLTEQIDLSKEDQDIWLSYSLCRLLARRYYGFHCAEEGDVKVRHFAMTRLGTDGYKRAFDIVEVQLAFLHDYFFTNSLHIMESSFYMMPHKMRITTAEWPPWSFIIGFVVLLLAVDKNNRPWIEEVLRTGSYGLHLFWAVTMLFSLTYLLITPEERLVAIYWRPIHIAFYKLNLLPNPTTSIWLRFLKHIYHSPNELDAHRPSQTQTSTAYWRHKIGQYSILLDYDRRRSRKKALVAWFQGLVRPQPEYRFIKHLPVEEEDVRVPDSMRKLVADTLRAIDGPPTNGTRSLKMNMDSAGYDWSWTCRQQTHTGTILIWHIATCYCDMLLHPSDHLEEGFPLLVETETFHEVAVALSRYCAYLVAFLPEFLPEHTLITKEVFQNVIQDAQSALGSTHMEEKEKHTKIRKLKLLPRRKQTTFHKGIRLGRQLEKLNTKLRWKVMAEFWAETILYVAPSDNAEAHIEHVAKGGEFITHLWAMLSNAGILKQAEGEWHPPRAPASTTTTEEPPKKIEITKARTQECPF